MAHSQSDDEVAKNIAQIVRLGRKKRGLSPRALACALGLPLSYIEKIELGYFEMEATLWLAITKFFDIDVDSMEDGFIDPYADARLSQCSEIGLFKIPDRYVTNQGSTVRSLLPFIEFIRRHLGEEKYLAYLRFKRLDPDYFLDLGHMLNINFALDVVRDMIHWGLVNADTVPKLVGGIHQPNVHGHLYAEYKQTQTVALLLEHMFSNIAKYEVNCSYRFENISTNIIDISVSPNAHLKEFKYSDSTLGNLTCLYKKHYIEKLTKLQNLSGGEVHEIECHLHGSSKCVYRVAV